MDTAITAALTATLGYAVGDVFTALLARRLSSGRASMYLGIITKLLLYAPLAFLCRHEFAHVDAYVLVWIITLGTVFAISAFGFNTAFHEGKSPALVGVVAGCFPAVATVIAIILGERPSIFTLVLLVTVLLGVAFIGLPPNWRRSLKIEKGLLFALLPMFGWGIYSAFLNKPISHLNTDHAWFVMQVSILIFMMIATSLIFNRHIPGFARDAKQKNAWWLLLLGGISIGGAEAMQALALSQGQTVITVALLGSYPAAYFFIAHKIFKEPLRPRQWIGIGLVSLAIVLLSAGSST